MNSGSAIDREPLLALAEWRRSGHRTALVTIVNIDGKSPRSVGARMAVRDDGMAQGYLTGGCPESELILVGKSAIAEGRNKFHRYGKGSTFVDLKLPCGSGIDVFFDQGLSDELVFQAEEHLLSRTPFIIEMTLASGESRIAGVGPSDQMPFTENSIDGKFRLLVKPRLHLNIVGVGMAPVQLAFLARTAGFDVTFVACDQLTVDAASANGIETERMPPVPYAPASDDFTASAVMFHEHERELPLLVQMLDKPGFYLGTIGSRTVADQRMRSLRALGVPEKALLQIRMQAGLVQRARSATEIAVGILAEVLDVARQRSLVG